jgi:DeoR family transcriptional regulator, catabolite repression regulator
MCTQKNNMMQVREVMMPIEKIPIIGEKVILKEALDMMGRSGLGIVCIVDDNRKLLAVFTDGDIRRMILNVQKPFSSLFVDDTLEHAIRSPMTIQSSETLVHAIGLMEQKQIWDLPVVDQGTLVGLLHLHPAVKALLGISE